MESFRGLVEGQNGHDVMASIKVSVLVVAAGSDCEAEFGLPLLHVGRVVDGTRPRHVFDYFQVPRSTVILRLRICLNACKDITTEFRWA